MFYIRDWTAGQLNALVKNLGEEQARLILTGNAQVRVENIDGRFFDSSGRRTTKGLKFKVYDPDLGVWVNRVRLTDADFAIRLEQSWLGAETGVTADEFVRKSYKLLDEIVDNPSTKSICNGGWLPVVLPQLTADDAGAALDRYLSLAARSYQKAFPNRRFVYEDETEKLANEIRIDSESRHQLLIERLRNGPVVGIHFPNPMQGFSLEASRSQMNALPKGFVLSGLDTVMAVTMYPDVMAYGIFVPVYELSALFSSDAEGDYFIYYLESMPKCLTFTFSRLEYYEEEEIKKKSTSGLFYMG